MKILIEHTVSVPYNPKVVTGGTERFSQQLLKALRDAGHDAQMFVTADTGKFPHTVHSFVPSTAVTVGRTYEDGSPRKSFTNLIGWYESIEKIHHEYDYIVLNSAFHSHGLLNHWGFLSKSLLINHFCHGGMLQGESGLRFQLLARWMQQLGGRVFSSGQSNIDELKSIWENPHINNRILTQYADKIKKFGIDIERPMFEGWFDVNVLPHDLGPVKKIKAKKVVAIGRPVREKQIITAAKAMKTLAADGYECHLFTTDIGEDYEKIKELCEKHGITIHINMPHKDIMKNICDAAVLLFPSKSETNGICAFEAAAHGIPVIHTCDEPAFFLEPAGLSHRFKADTQKRAADAMVTLVRSIKQTDEERAVARAHFVEKYSEQALVDRLIAHLPINTVKYTGPTRPFKEKMRGEK